MHRLSAAAIALFALCLVVASPHAAATTPPTPPTPSAPPVTNDFIPDDQNLSDCIGTLQRPGCGSESKGDWQTLLVFGVLVAGLTFIGWRIVAGLRSPPRATTSVSPQRGPGDSAR